MANKDLTEQSVDSETSKKIIAELSTSSTSFSGASNNKKMRPDDVIETDKLVNEMASLLKIARHPDTAVTIKAAKILLENLSSSQSSFSLDKQTSSKLSSKIDTECGDESKIRIQQSKFKLEDIPLPGALMINWKNKHKKGNSNDEDNGYKEEDKELDIAFEQAAKALRLLYLNDQKQLQLQVNEIISTIQSVTANPKTDSRLGSFAR